MKSVQHFLVLTLLATGCTSGPATASTPDVTSAAEGATTAVSTAVSETAPLVSVYPDPGDLSDAKGLTRSTTFDVAVNGAPAFVYQAGQGWSFLSFAFANTEAVVEVTVNQPIGDWQVRPVAKGIQPTQSGNRFTFALSGPRKFILQINGRDGDKLLISAEPPENDVPSPEDPSVLYYGPGVHFMGAKFTPPTGIRTIYLAGGAVVRGSVFLRDRASIRITGRGIFAMGEWRQEPDDWDALEQGISLGNVRNIVIDGITIVDSPGAPLQLWGQTATVRNVKIIESTPYARNGSEFSDMLKATFSDFFILANDDALSINQASKDFEFRDGILWNKENGASFMLSGRGGPIRNMVFEDIDVLENGGEGTGVFSIRWGGVRRDVISGVTFRDIRVENATGVDGAPIEMIQMQISYNPQWNEGSLGSVLNLKFDGVAFPFGGGIISGADPRNQFSDVDFHNCTVGGQPLTDFSQLQVETKFVEGLSVSYDVPATSESSSASSTATPAP